VKRRGSNFKKKATAIKNKPFSIRVDKAKVSKFNSEKNK
jgi:hypothetical protein